ncbi:MAG: glycosyltransferase family 8 protein [Bryobacterales bacterium]|nr:glycosyltransferase family 8 protein [Bryobacterales bacterium]
MNGTSSGPPILIACASDGRYALPLAVMLRSLAENLAPGREVEVIILDDGIAPADRERVLASLPASLAVRFVDYPRTGIQGLPTWGRMALTTYHKLTLAHWIPQAATKVLWLDCDLLVLADIARLWDSLWNGQALLAVPDERVPTVSSPFGVAAYREMGLASGAAYFNAGVLLIDLDRWRSGDVERRATDYLKQYGNRVYFFDQEALNATLAGRWGVLDGRWNRHPSIAAFHGGSAAGAPFIVHFSGNLKPWIHAGRSRYHEMYYDYLDRTAWSGWRPRASLKAALLSRYETSGLRRLLYPAEHLWMRAVRAMTWRENRASDEKGLHG